MKRNICVLGASGFVGSKVHDYLVAQGRDVFGVSRNSEQANLRVVNFENKQVLKDLFKGASVVVNAVGSFKPRDFEHNPNKPFDSMMRYMKYLDDGLKNSQVERMIHISSAGTVYGENNGLPHSEQDLPVPETWYGRMKLLEEGQVRTICEKHNIECIVVRLTNPYGNTKADKHGFIDVLVKSMYENKPFVAYADSSQKRDFIHVDDMAKVVVQLIDKPTTGQFEIYNVGSGKSVSLHWLVAEIDKQLGGVKYQQSDSAGKGLGVVSVDIEKLKKEINLDWVFTKAEDYILTVLEDVKRMRNV